MKKYQFKFLKKRYYFIPLSFTIILGSLILFAMFNYFFDYGDNKSLYDFTIVFLNYSPPFIGYFVVYVIVNLWNSKDTHHFL
jgi:hypothetical protein